MKFSDLLTGLSVVVSIFGTAPRTGEAIEE
jgi:hypothetical protein